MKKNFEYRSSSLSSNSNDSSDLELETDPDTSYPEAKLRHSRLDYGPQLYDRHRHGTNHAREYQGSIRMMYSLKGRGGFQRT